jgi:hypothetical protein
MATTIGRPMAVVLAVFEHNDDDASYTPKSSEIEIRHDFDFKFATANH